jgi:hypothetical protein
VAVSGPAATSFVTDAPSYARGMCRNITELRGLEPPATREEIEAAARQYVRKVTGISKPNPSLADQMESAALEVASITEELLAEVPKRRQPPKSVPPLRRPEVRKRLGLEPLPA